MAGITSNRSQNNPQTYRHRGHQSTASSISIQSSTSSHHNPQQPQTSGNVNKSSLSPQSNLNNNENLGTTGLQSLFDSLLQTYYAEAGLEAILLTDRDGVPLARSVVVHNMMVNRPDQPDSIMVPSIPFVVQLLTEPAFLAVSPVAGDHSNRLGLGKPRTATTFLQGYSITQIWTDCRTLTLTLIGDRSCNQYSETLIESIGNQLRKLINEISNKVRDSSILRTAVE